jgi:hypothetical protein
MTDTGRAAGRSKPKGTVTGVGEKTRIAWEPGPVGIVRALSTCPRNKENPSPKTCFVRG